MANIVFQLTADDADLVKALRDAGVGFEAVKSKSQEAGTATDKAMAMATGAAKVLAGAVTAAAAGFVVWGQEIADVTNDINDLSNASGVAATTLNGIRTAARASGGSLSDFTKTFQQLPKRLSDFGKGTGEAKDALEGLGFQASDSDAMLADMDGTVRTLLEAVQGMPTAGERAALATELFGGKGARLAQVLGDIPLDEFIAAADEFSVDVGPAASAAAAKWEIDMSRLADVMTRTKGEVVNFAQSAGVSVGAFTLGLVYLKDIGSQIADLFGQNLTTAFSAFEMALQGDIRGAAELLLTQRQLSAELGDMSERATETARRFWEQTQAMYGAVDAGDQLTTTMGATSRETEAAARATDQHRAALSSYAKLAREFTADQMTAEDELLRAAQDRFDAVDQAQRDSIISAEQAAQDRLAITERLNRDLDALDRERAAADRDQRRAYVDGWHEANNQRAEDTKEAFEKIEQLSQIMAARLITGWTAIAAASESAAASSIRAHQRKTNRLKGQLDDYYDAFQNAEDAATRNQIQQDANRVKSQIEAQKQREAAAVAAAAKAARNQKQASIFEVLTNTAAAITKAFALFGPPPSPAGLFAAGAAGAAGAAQIAAINKAPEPRYFRGTEGAVEGGRTDRGEGVVNRAAMQQPGVAELVGALNTGMSRLAGLVGGGGGPTEGDVYLDGERVGRWMARGGTGPHPGYVSAYGRI